MSWLTYQVHVLTSSHCRISANPSPPTLVCASSGHRYVSMQAVPCTCESLAGHVNSVSSCVFHAAAVCSMRSLCVRCRHGVFDAGTLQHLKAWMRSPHDPSCTGRWSVVDCTEGRRQKCVEVSSTTRCKPYHDTARSAPHCRISVNPSPPTSPLDSTVFSIDVRVSRTHLQRHRMSTQRAGAHHRYTYELLRAAGSLTSLNTRGAPFVLSTPLLPTALHHMHVPLLRPVCVL